MYVNDESLQSFEVEMSETVEKHHEKTKVWISCMVTAMLTMLIRAFVFITNIGGTMPLLSKSEISSPCGCFSIVQPGWKPSHDK